MKVAVIDASLAVKAVLPNPLRDSCRRILGFLHQERFELLLDLDPASLGPSRAELWKSGGYDRDLIVSIP